LRKNDGIYTEGLIVNQIAVMQKEEQLGQLFLFSMSLLARKIPWFYQGWIINGINNLQ